MEVYFDNSATTKVFDCVRDIVVKTMRRTTGTLPPSTKRAWRRSSTSAGPPLRLQRL